MKRIITLLLAISLIFCCNLNTLAFDSTTNTMKVAINAEFPPFEYIENGEYKGFDIDLMKYIGQQMNCNIEFINMDFDRIIPSVANGAVDCGISAITKTEERKQNVDFSENYIDCEVTYIENGVAETGLESYAIVLPKNSYLKNEINSAIDKAKVAQVTNIAYKYNIKYNNGIYEYSFSLDTNLNDSSETNSNEFVIGYTFYEPFNYNDANGTLVGFDTELAMYVCNKIGVTPKFVEIDWELKYLEVESENIDCIWNGMLITDEAKKNIAISYPYTTYEGTPIGIGFKKGNSIVDKVNEALSDAKKDGTLAYLGNKYNVDIYDIEIPNKTNGFTDVSEKHWAYKYITDMTNRGLLSGYGNGKFGPDDTITRGQFATIMCRAAGLEAPSITQSSYVDVSSSDWFAPYVEAAKHFLSGFMVDGKMYYKPNENAVREDIAVALVKLKGYDVSDYNEEELKAKFSDWQSISKEARKYVFAAVKNGLINGYEDNTFRGQASITRAEASTLFWKAFQVGNDNKIF